MCNNCTLVPPARWGPRPFFRCCCRSVRPFVYRFPLLRSVFFVSFPPWFFIEPSFRTSTPSCRCVLFCDEINSRAHAGPWRYLRQLWRDQERLSRNRQQRRLQGLWVREGTKPMRTAWVRGAALISLHGLSVYCCCDFLSALPAGTEHVAFSLERAVKTLSRTAG